MNLAKFKIHIILIGFNLINKRPALNGVKATVYKWKNADGHIICLRYFNPFKFTFYLLHNGNVNYLRCKGWNFKEVLKLTKTILKREEDG